MPRRRRKPYTPEELLAMVIKRAINNVIKQLSYEPPRGKPKKMPGGWTHRYF